MKLQPYVERLATDLAAASGVDAQTQTAARHLVVALEPALRLTALELLSDAFAQASAELHEAVVEIRLDGRDPRIVVTQAAAATPPSSATPSPGVGPSPGADPGAAGGDEEPAMARISLRLPEPLKARADQAAGADGVSLNAWLVSTIGAALGSGPRATRTRRGNRMTGWV